MTFPSSNDARRGDREQISRRGFLLGAAAGVGTLALSGCGSGVTAGLTGSTLDKQTVSYWNLFGGGDGARMQQMQAGFEKANKDLGLSAVTLAWGSPYYTKLTLATLGAKPPDVAVAHLTRMKNLQQGGLLEELTPDLLAKYDLSAEKFNPTAWKAGLVDGKAYALPLDTHPFVLFYNTDICGKAGLLVDGKLPAVSSPEQFVDMLNKAKAAGAETPLVVSVTADPATNWRQFQSLYSQLGGSVLAADGTKVVIDDAKAQQALEFMKSLSDQKLINPALDYGGAIALFTSGKAAFFMQGEWEITTMQTAKLPFSMTLYPNIFGGPNYKVQGDSHTLVLPKQPGGGGTQRWDRSMRFVKSMMDQSLTWAQGGHIPSYLPVKDSSEYADLKPQSEYAAAADGAVYDPPAWYGGSGSDFENVVGASVATVVQGQASVQQAIHSMHSKLDVYATTPSPL